MNRCQCGHVLAAHEEGKTCGGTDPAINRNWCACARFTLTAHRAVLARQVQRWRGYWFHDEATAIRHVKRAYGL